MLQYNKEEKCIYASVMSRYENASVYIVKDGEVEVHNLYSYAVPSEDGFISYYQYNDKNIDKQEFQSLTSVTQIN